MSVALYKFVLPSDEEFVSARRSGNKNMMAAKANVHAVGRRYVTEVAPPQFVSIVKKSNVAHRVLDTIKEEEKDATAAAAAADISLPAKSYSSGGAVGCGGSRRFNLPAWSSRARRQSSPSQ